MILFTNLINLIGFNGSVHGRVAEPHVFAGATPRSKSLRNNIIHHPSSKARRRPQRQLNVQLISQSWCYAQYAPRVFERNISTTISIPIARASSSLGVRPLMNLLRLLRNPFRNHRFSHPRHESLPILKHKHKPRFPPNSPLLTERSVPQAIQLPKENALWKRKRV